MEEDAESSSLNYFESPVNVTDIDMVSLPESSTRLHESTTPKDFQAPPEGSLPASSEEQKPPAAAVDTRSSSHETIAADEICKDAGRVVAHGVSTGTNSKNLKGETGSEASGAKNQILKDLLDALKMTAGELEDGSS
ncbi:hypothetical protein U1Q18_046081 [Sarracenia purpurea var. burkii]